MDKKFTIARMSKHEMPFALSWAANEGWNPGCHDADCFYQADPHGFFAGTLDGKIIAIGSAVVYDDHFAFCGFYIVDKAHRGQGYGLALTKHRLAYIGGRNAGIDGVTTMLEKYARLGYKIAHNNARYINTRSIPIIKTNHCITPLTQINFDLLTNYDRRHFPAPRPSFLHCWIHQQGSKSLGYILDGTLCGYGVIRACQQGFKIGPLFADNPTIANELFINLAQHAKDQPIYLDIPENNLYAKDLVKQFQMEKVFETARMYLKEPPKILMEHVYGITSFELG